MPDVERLTRKLERKKVSLADLCQLYRASSKIPHICNALAAHEGAHAQLLAAKCASNSKPSAPPSFPHKLPNFRPTSNISDKGRMSFQDLHPPTIPCRFCAPLEDAHGAERLTKFEELLEAAVDLDRIPDEYLISAAYDADLQVGSPTARSMQDTRWFLAEYFI